MITTVINRSNRPQDTTRFNITNVANSFATEVEGQGFLPVESVQAYQRDNYSTVIISSIGKEHSIRGVGFAKCNPAEDVLDPALGERLAFKRAASDYIEQAKRMQQRMRFITGLASLPGVRIISLGDLSSGAIQFD